MPKRLSLKFALHEGGGRARPGNEQPPVMRVESAWSARQFESIFAAQRRQWFGDELQRFADNIAAMLQQEHELSLKWEGLPGTDHPVHWTGAADSLSKAQPQVRAGRRLSVWHPPLAWVMPLVARQPMHLAVHLPLTLNEDALEEMARSALPRGWERQRVVVRLDIETRMYWGARAGNSLATWKPCQRRGDGLSDTIPLFTLRRGRVERRVCGAGDFAPMLARHVPAGIGLLVAVPVFSFERRRVVRQVVDRWWREAWQRIGWVCPDDRDPTFVHRIEADEPFWNDATGAAP
ncbi:MAG TPA: hypothetical protein VFP68_11820, partial [Burkholderiaceae bacterium]|nr:hypothetical protein [Burkholderiaceae bacterium]